MDRVDPVEFSRWTSGEWKKGTPDGFLGIANDSRKLEPGKLFAALKTATRDGHDFVGDAANLKAAGAIVERVQEETELPQLLVADVGRALLEGARGYRSSWAAKVVGVTGSCGKTTCKEVLAALLAGRKTLSTLGNLNNLIGVPLSILRPEGKDAEFAVLEAGISEPGEMEKLATCIQPEFAIITAVGPAHLEDLETVENVAREKGKLLAGLDPRKVFLGETCEPYLAEIACSGATLVKRDHELSTDYSFDFQQREGTSRLRLRIDGTIEEFEYTGSGRGLASNVALALVTAARLGISVEELKGRLKSWKPSQMRNEWRAIRGRKVFVDCYNANPVSMNDSIETFVSESPESQPRLFLIGCMEELGRESNRLHQELGSRIPLRKEDFLLVIGSEASSVLRGMRNAGTAMDNCLEIREVTEANEQLSSFRGSVFLKGSRRYKLESVLNSLEGGVTC